MAARGRPAHHSGGRRARTRARGAGEGTNARPPGRADGCTARRGPPAQRAARPLRPGRAGGHGPGCAAARGSSGRPAHGRSRRRLRRRPRGHRAGRPCRGPPLAARPRIPSADAVLTPGRRRDARRRLARGRAIDPGQGRRGGACRLPRHLPGQAARRARVARRGDHAGLPLTRGGGRRLGAGVLHHPRALVPRPARRGGDRGCPSELRAPARRRARDKRHGADRLPPERGKRARGVPGRTALPRRGATARRPVHALPRARAGRVRARRRGRPGHARVRDPGGDHVPGRRGSGVRRPLERPRQARCRRHRPDRRARRRPRRAARGGGPGPFGRGRGVDRGDHGPGARPGRADLPRGLAGLGRSRRLRRHLDVARRRRRRRSRGGVREGRAGAARGLRVLRVRPRAAAARSRPRPLRPHRGVLLVRRRRAARPGAADPPQGRRRGGDRDARRASTPRSPTRRPRSAPARPHAPQS